MRLSGWLVLLSILSAGLSTSAQDMLFVGETVSGTIAADGADRWQIIAQEGDVLSFIVRADDTQGDDTPLDPALRIEDSSGNLIIENDDYQYPSQLDAIIEAFNVPQSGLYIVEVRGFGTTTGAYNLVMLPGYSDLIYDESFQSVAAWTMIAPDGSAAEMSALNDHLILSQQGVDQPIFAIQENIVDAAVYHIFVTIQDINGSDGWRVGVMARYRDADNHVQVQINHNGAWRVVATTDGTERILSDWALHPAITAGQVDFSLAVLVNNRQYDIFYDGVFIGQAAGEQARDGNGIGLLLTSANAVGSRVRAEYDQLLITVPRAFPAETDRSQLPPVLTSRSTQALIRELERQQLIGTGGQMALTVDESNVRYNEQGISRIPIAPNLRPANFVLGGMVDWETGAQSLTGCGFVVRDALPDDRYVLAYVESSGGYGVSQREGDRFTTSIFGDTLQLGSPPYELTVISSRNQIHYYLNRQYAGSINSTETSGGIGEAVVNFDAMNTQCQFRNLWLWQLDAR